MVLMLLRRVGGKLLLETRVNLILGVDLRISDCEMSP